VPGNFRRCIGLEGMHNFSVMAPRIAKWESRFLYPCDFKELGVAKRSRSTTSARSALRPALEHHSGEPNIFEGRKQNLNVVQPKLFQATRQDDLPLFRLHGGPSFKFLTMQMQPSASWARNADRSIRDHHVRRQAAQPLTILPPVAALAVGLPAQRGYRAAI